MPVNETVEFERALRRELDMAIDAIVVNAVHPARFRAEEARRLEKAGEAGRASAVAQAALKAALSEHRRARAEHAQLRRLRRAATAPVGTLPRIFEPELGRDELERLSIELERKL
jgi:NAD(P)-dependent dehydrogenase (short-subunit alcohol dehydrogenase family)